MYTVEKSIHHIFVLMAKNVHSNRYHNNFSLKCPYAEKGMTNKASKQYCPT